MVVSDNDRCIVRAVQTYRLLSQRQIECLLNRSRSTVQRLLRRLYDHGYLDRLFIPVRTIGSSSAVYVMDRAGVLLLRQMGDDVKSLPNSYDLSGLFLEHTLALNNVRIAIEQGSQQRGWVVTTWRSERDLKADYDRVIVPGRKRRVALVPDGYFVLHMPGREPSHFFVELDRGTMTCARFQDKVRAYVAYYKSGQYKQRYRSPGFRLLTVVAGVGRGRLHSLMQATSQVGGIGRRFWFAHLDDVDSQTILSGAIWQVAGDETAQTLFD